MIAIIAVLAAMLLPALGKARETARTSLCANNMKQGGLAFLLYADDYDDYIAYDTRLTSWSITTHNYGLPYNDGHLNEYTGGMLFTTKITATMDLGKMLYCPSYERTPDRRNHQQLRGKNGVPTTVDNNNQYARSYRVNDWFMEIPSTNTWVSNDCGTAKPQPKLTHVRRPEALVMLGEAYSKNQFKDFGDIYLNPRHGHRSPVVRADGSVALLTILDSGATGHLHKPNQNVNDSYPVDTWGTYLHPCYTKKY